MGLILKGNLRDKDQEAGLWFSRIVSSSLAPSLLLAFLVGNAAAALGCTVRVH